MNEVKEKNFFNCEVSTGNHNTFYRNTGEGWKVKKPLKLYVGEYMKGAVHEEENWAALDKQKEKLSMY